MRLFLILLSAILFTSFKPGDPVATLTCKSSSGSIVFRAILPSAQHLEVASYNQGGKVTTYSLTDKTQIVFDPEKKTFTIEITSDANGQVQLTAVPATFKLVKNEKGNGTGSLKVYNFQGKFSTSLSKQKMTLNCVLEYEL